MRTSCTLVLGAQTARAGTKGNESKKGKIQSEKAKKRHGLVRLRDVMRNSHSCLCLPGSVWFLPQSRTEGELGTGP